MASSPTAPMPAKRSRNFAPSILFWQILKGLGQGLFFVEAGDLYYEIHSNLSRGLVNLNFGSSLYAGFGRGDLVSLARKMVGG